MYQTLKITRSEQIAILTIDRPEALNAINETVMEELSDAIAAVERNDLEGGPVGGLIITGAGRSFVAGADIGVQSRFSTSDGLDWGRKGNGLMRRIELLPIPVIAAVNGFALGGGCELAMACDVIVASEKAKFGQPEVGLGITPGFGGTQRLARRVGMGRAKELIFSGRTFGAAEAEAMGLVQKVTSPETLLEEAVSMMKGFLKNGPKAVAYSKDAINRGMETDPDTGIAIENACFSLCFATQDQKEGMTAFLEKRPAAFKNC